MQRNDFSNSGRGSPKKHFCEIILKSVYWSRRRCHLKVFLFLLYLWRPVCSAEQNGFSNFGRGSSKKHFYGIILKSVRYSRRRCHLKAFLFLALVAILLSGAERF